MTDPKAKHRTTVKKIRLLLICVTPLKYKKGANTGFTHINAFVKLLAIYSLYRF
jgi:hypothetical protein